MPSHSQNSPEWSVRACPERTRWFPRRSVPGGSHCLHSNALGFAHTGVSEAPSPRTLIDSSYIGECWKKIYGLRDVIFWGQKNFIDIKDNG